MLNNSFGIINSRLSYRDFKLEFIEVVRLTDQGNPQKKKYKYHFQDDTNVLIFRYDNVPHHPQVNTFPHHKHTEAGILECKEPDLFNILLEVERIIRSS